MTDLLLICKRHATIGVLLHRPICFIALDTTTTTTVVVVCASLVLSGLWQRREWRWWACRFEFRSARLQPYSLYTTRSSGSLVGGRERAGGV